MKILCVRCTAAWIFAMARKSREKKKTEKCNWMLRCINICCCLTMLDAFSSTFQMWWYQCKTFYRSLLWKLTISFVLSSEFWLSRPCHFMSTFLFLSSDSFAFSILLHFVMAAIVIKQKTVSIVCVHMFKDISKEMNVQVSLVCNMAMAMPISLALRCIYSWTRASSWLKTAHKTQITHQQYI